MSHVIVGIIAALVGAFVAKLSPSVDYRRIVNRHERELRKHESVWFNKGWYAAIRYTNSQYGPNRPKDATLVMPTFRERANQDQTILFKKTS